MVAISARILVSTTAETGRLKFYGGSADLLSLAKFARGAPKWRQAHCEKVTVRAYRRNWKCFRDARMLRRAFVRLYQIASTITRWSAEPSTSLLRSSTIQSACA